MLYLVKPKLWYGAFSQGAKGALVEVPRVTRSASICVNTTARKSFQVISPYRAGGRCILVFCCLTFWKAFARVASH